MAKKHGYRAAWPKSAVIALAEKTADCYSFDRYANWAAVIDALARRGYTARQIEAIVRSKWTRWAGDMSKARYGRITSRDLLRFMDSQRDLQREVDKLTRETFAEAA